MTRGFKAINEAQMMPTFASIADHVTAATPERVMLMPSSTLTNTSRTTDTAQTMPPSAKTATTPHICLLPNRSFPITGMGSIHTQKSIATLTAAADTQ